MGPQTIGLPTTGAVVASAVVVPAAGTGIAAVADYCKVLGDINPVDPTAPKIKFQVNLPFNWNGKAVMFGGRGYNACWPQGWVMYPPDPLTSPRHWHAAMPHLAATQAIRPMPLAAVMARLVRMMKH